ncbi:autophagy protein [Dispira parvispora]|uniref:Autophagy protein n=1 Tax=Dispira parvispora TaxID=1520584 RepID=A0A9W8E833_9FUNG|nr:autophagy protein [Dispira parvispora]
MADALYCQRCQHRLTLDPSLQRLTTEAKQVIEDTLPIPSTLPRPDTPGSKPQQPETPPSKSSRPPSSIGPAETKTDYPKPFKPQASWVGGRAPSDSFVVLTQSQVLGCPPLGQTLESWYDEHPHKDQTSGPRRRTDEWKTTVRRSTQSKPKENATTSTAEDTSLPPTSSAADIVPQDNPIPMPTTDGTRDSPTSATEPLSHNRSSSSPSVPSRAGTPVSGKGTHPAKEATSLCHTVNIQERLMDMLAMRSELRHPLCQECTEQLLDLLDKQLQNAEREHDFYQQCSKNIHLDTLSAEEQRRINTEIKVQKEREKALQDTIQNLEQQYQNVVQELRDLEEEERLLSQEEDEFWSQRNKFQIRLDDFQNTRETINLEYDHLSGQLMDLQRTNVYNDTFNIVYNCPIGAINGLRLGRLPSQPVEWSEINAAWGQLLFLLHTVARKVNFTFTHYRLVPLGSFSRIEKTSDDNAVYELYGSGDLHLGRLLHNRRFDLAMVAFLHCLQELEQFIQRHSPHHRLPYAIHKDKVGNVSIKFQFGQEETWTSALKHTLTNCKWILAYAASFVPSTT